MFHACRKDDSYYESLMAKAKTAGGSNDDTSETSDEDPEQLLREMVQTRFE